MNLSTPADLASIIASRYQSCVFLSPHLDDAVFSAGDLLLTLQDLGVNCIIVTFFTTVHPYRPTLSARAFLSQSNEPDPTTLFTNRRSEDSAIFSRHQMVAIHYPFTDAMWRTKPHPSLIDRALGSLLSEFLHLYPTYRLHIAKGRIHPKDPAPMAVLGAIAKLKTKYPNALFFAPIGTGLHTDHLIVRNAAVTSKALTVFWNDYPYSLHSSPDAAFIRSHSLQTVSFLHSWDQKRKFILEYQTQVSAIFPNGVPVKGEEMFYLPSTVDILSSNTS